MVRFEYPKITTQVIKDKIKEDSEALAHEASPLLNRIRRSKFVCIALFIVSVITFIVIPAVFNMLYVPHSWIENNMYYGYSIPEVLEKGCTFINEFLMRKVHFANHCTSYPDLPRSGEKVMVITTIALTVLYAATIIAFLTWALIKVKAYFVYLKYIPESGSLVKDHIKAYLYDAYISEKRGLKGTDNSEYKAFMWQAYFWGSSASQYYDTLEFLEYIKENDNLKVEFEGFEDSNNLAFKLTLDQFDFQKRQAFIGNRALQIYSKDNAGTFHFDMAFLDNCFNEIIGDFA